MSIPRSEALLVVSLLFLVGLAATVARILRARKQGLSIRLQVFLAMASTTLFLSASFAVIVVDRFEARAVVFAHRAAQDDADIIAKLAEGAMAARGQGLRESTAGLAEARVLSAFASDTRVELIDAGGRSLFDSRGARGGDDLRALPEVSEALAGQAGGSRTGAGGVAAASPISSGGVVVGVSRVEKSTLGVTQLTSDLVPKVALLAL